MKKMLVFNSIIGLLTLFVTSCSIEPEPIKFGKDQCHFCKMTIVDKVHAAQYVTKKGKQFKFDAIECMVDEINNLDESKLGVILIADYGNLGKMTDATKAAYLISDQIKSPMGANLSGFKDNDKAKELQKKLTGTLVTWETLKKQRKQ